MKLNSHISIVLEDAEGDRKRKEMDCHRMDQAGEAYDEAAPKLSIFSLPRKPPETPGMATPPLHSAVTVPFQWEEAPGRPRPNCTGDYKPPSARCLELPPRLLNETGRVTSNSIPSPTTVLEGPYSGRLLSSTWSFRKGGSLSSRSPELGGSKRSTLEGVKVPQFGSSRWVKAENEAEEDPLSILEEDRGGSLISGSSEPKLVKTSKLKRRGSRFQGKSHLWASIYESIKQAVPWRRRHQKTTGYGYGYGYGYNIDHHHEMFG